jgi:SAM-dependent methyltransferase
MSSEHAEDFFAKIYLHFIRQDIKDTFGDKKIRILDVGCGQGRLSIPLAQDGHRITGIDISSEAIRIAGQRAQKQNITLDLRLIDITRDTMAFPVNSFDCIICTEMIYMVERPENLLRLFTRLANPGGLVIVSFRPKMYYVLNAILRKSWKDLKIISATKGSILNGISLNWFTLNEAIALLEDAGITLRRACSIGKFSGIEGDPQARFCNPAELDNKARKYLMELEIRQAEANADSGRYLYTSGTVTKITQR